MEKFIVSARKYRPSTFDEVIGQDHISATLKNALATGHLGHAYLFTGQRGVGKTTCARILAKVINCHNPVENHTPCNVCPSCQAFNENASFNIIEMDAASNNTVDQMRSLVEQVRFQPQGGKYKVYIIDEVHMLSSSAFNAFLKTLEEPPEHAIFILATTEKHKIIPTILSRCQIFDFKGIQNSDIIKNLEQICEAESIEYEREALHIIAEKADGAMRDALSIFDRIVSSVDKKITYKDVIINLNILDYDYYFKLMDAILLEDLGKVLLLYNEIRKNGFEGHVFLNGFSEHLRQLMVSKDPQTIQLIESGEKLKKRYLDQAYKTKLNLIINALNIANQCDLGLSRAQNKQVHVEIALTKMVFLERKLSDINQFEAKKKPYSKIKSKQEIIPPVKEKEDPESLAIKKESENPVSEKLTDSAVDQKDENINSGSAKKFSKLSILHEEIEKEIKENRKSKKPFSKQIVQNIVDQYIENTTSPYVINVLKEIKLDLFEKKVRIFVPSQQAEDVVKQEISLIEQIRGIVPDNEYHINIMINKELFPNYKELKPKKILTNKERFELFQEKNELVKRVVDEFDLKIDAD